jgi:hypothetical protein
MDTFLFSFTIWLLCYWLLLAQLGQAIGEAISWWVQIFLGMVLLLIVLVLFVILSLV